MASLSEYTGYINSIINGKQLSDTGTVQNIYTVCDYYGTEESDEEYENWNDVAASKTNITQYWCIYQTQFEIIGTTGAILPELHSGGRYNRCEHEWCVSNRVSIQTNCNGHKLVDSNFRNQYENLPKINAGSKITYNFLNQLIDVINFQIGERYASNKYKEYYDRNSISSEIELVTDDKINDKLSIDYNEYMSNIITKLSSLQSNTIYDSYSASDKFKTLKNIKYTLQGSKDLEFEDYKDKWIKPSMVLSESNMDIIKDVIKKDLNDCICYSDCNGYAVCYCYGNCNHY